MLLHVTHTTRYNYDGPVSYALQQIRLTPKDRPGQRVISWDIAVDGGKRELGFTDHHANQVDLVSITPEATSITLTCQGEVEVTANDGVVGQHQGFMPLWSFLRATPLTKPGAQVRQLNKDLGDDFESDIARAHALSALITGRVPYKIGSTEVTTNAEGALTAAGGVCQDHAHIFIAAMRLLGHPARYVSGYLMMNDRVSQDATHAWAEAHFDGIGWIGFDVSNGYSPDERYIRVATGLDYRDAAPMLGMRYGQGSEKLVVEVQVQQ